MAGQGDVLCGVEVMGAAWKGEWLWWGVRSVRRERGRRPTLDGLHVIITSCFILLSEFYSFIVKTRKSFLNEQIAVFDGI